MSSVSAAGAIEHDATGEGGVESRLPRSAAEAIASGGAGGGARAADADADANADATRTEEAAAPRR